MKRTFYKSLDRDVELVKIRGRWIYVAVGGILGFIVLGVIMGAFFGIAVGLITALVGAAACFFGCAVLQVKVPSRQLYKFFLSGKMDGWAVRREALSRILLKDARYERYRKVRSAD